MNNLEAICECGSECQFQGDIGEVQEWKCKACGRIYRVMDKGFQVELP